MPKTVRKMGSFSSETMEPRRKREESEGKGKQCLTRRQKHPHLHTCSFSMTELPPCKVLTASASGHPSS